MKTLIILSVLALAASIVPSARAQLQQPLVFSSGGAVASRNDQTGALTPVAGSPFTAANQSLVIDVQGRFLFAIGTSSIHMFQITDSTTGAYHEVVGSPFASSVTNQPAFIAVEPTGQFIAVVNHVGQNPGDGLVETFQISPSASGGPALIPIAGSATELDSTAIGFAQPPDNKTFLIFMGPNPQSTNTTIAQGSEFHALSIDPQTGFITGLQPNAALPQRGLSFAMDPQGRYYVTGTRDNLLEFGIIQLFGIGGDGLLGNIQLSLQNYPDGLWIDSTGAFLYVAISHLGAPKVVNIYSVNLQTGALTQAASSPLPGYVRAARHRVACGFRLLTDDASDSPQTINLNGTANPAISVGPAPGGSTSATVIPGQTATYNLQITPGPGYSGTISIAYSGAPLGANIQVPSTLQISNGNAAAFTVMVTTSGSAAAPLFYSAPRSIPFPWMRVLPALLACAFVPLVLALSPKRNLIPRPKRLAFSVAGATISVLLLLGTAGCGGGSTSPSAPQTPKIVTPQGTSTITITPSAMSTSGKPLPLQPIQLTLTVN